MVFGERGQAACQASKRAKLRRPGDGRNDQGNPALSQPRRTPVARGDVQASPAPQAARCSFFLTVLTTSTPLTAR